MAAKRCEGWLTTAGWKASRRTTVAAAAASLCELGPAALAPSRLCSAAWRDESRGWREQRLVPQRWRGRGGQGQGRRRRRRQRQEKSGCVHARTKGRRAKSLATAPMSPSPRRRWASRSEAGGGAEGTYGAAGGLGGGQRGCTRGLDRGDKRGKGRGKQRCRRSLLWHRARGRKR